MFGHTGATGALFDVSTPDSAAVSVTDDFELAVRVSVPGSSISTTTFIGKDGSSLLSWAFACNAGSLVLNASSDGTTISTVNSDASLPVFANTWVWYKVTRRKSDGRVQFFYSLTDTNDQAACVWVQHGANKTLLAATSLHDHNGIVKIGRSSGFHAWGFTGKMRRATIKNGIDGTTVFDADFTALPAQTRTFAESSANAATVTINGNSTGGQFAHSYLSLPGRSGYSATSPDSAAVSITGDIDIRVATTLDDPTPAAIQSFLAKYSTGSNQRSYHFAVNTDGTLFAQASSDGSGANTKLFTSSVAPTLVANQLIALRAAIDIDNGASGATATFYTKATTAATAKADCESDAGWTTLGTAQTSAGAMANIYDSTAQLEIGQGNPLAGRMHAACIKNGINGTIAFSADFTTLPTGTANFLESSANAAVVTVNGPVVADRSGNHRDGIAVNGVVFGTRGKVGMCGTFDGVNDYARVTQWTPSTANVTVSAWVKPTAITGSNQSIANAGNSALGGFSLIMLATSGKAGARIYNGTTGITCDGNTALSTTVWTHVAMTFDGSNIRLYINGVLDAGPTAATGTVTALDLLVGAFNATTPSAFFGGLLDDVIVSPTEWTADQIKQEYNRSRISKNLMTLFRRSA
jgi:hypothetical protein